MFDIVKTKLLGLYLDNPSLFSPYPLWQLYKIYDQSKLELIEDDGIPSRIVLTSGEIIRYYWDVNQQFDMNQLIHDNVNEILVHKNYLNSDMQKHTRVEEMRYRMMLKTRNYNAISKTHHYQFKTINVENDYMNRTINILTSMGFIIDEQQLKTWINLKVFNHHYWFVMVDASINRPVGIGIADYDALIREGIIKHIEVLPKYNNLGLEVYILEELINRLRDKSDIITTTLLDEKDVELYKKTGFNNLQSWYRLRLMNG